MYPAIVTKDSTAVEVDVQAAFQAMFSDGNAQFVPQALSWASDCFTGRYGDYQAVDARYHDFEHTLQGTLCMARLLRGRHLAGAQPQLTEHMFQLGMMGILLHDTGYLKKNADTEGTGAKYTITHVARSAEFASELMEDKGFNATDILAAQNMIQCTGLDSAVEGIPFQSELEKIAGCALGTADLLGQMAADDYVDKLPILYSEFAEAAQYSKNRTHFITMFSSAEDLMQKTPMFWETFVQKKLNNDFGGLHLFLNDPYPSGGNDYLKRIESNMQRLKKRIRKY
jgi:hypothetical protein